MTKTFLLGVGGHKCGTTWLHDYLSKSPQTKMGIFKEYHIFDALTLSDGNSFYRRRIEEAQEALRAPGFRFENEPRLWKRLTFLADTQEYFDYFAGLLSRPKVRLTGDITPAYSGLSAETFAMIRRKVRSRGLQMRVIFLMRDPLERCWSAVRMERREKLRVRPDHIFRTSEAEDLKTLVHSGNFVMRTRYDRTIAALESVFAPEEILYGFYETLFDPAEVARICAFLGIDMHPPEFEVRKNVSPKSESLDGAAERAVVYSYRETYEFIAARFGAERMAGIWRGYGLIAGAPAV
jgi:hypothetical protein